MKTNHRSDLIQNGWRSLPTIGESAPKKWNAYLAECIEQLQSRAEDLRNDAVALAGMYNARTQNGTARDVLEFAENIRVSLETLVNELKK